MVCSGQPGQPSPALSRSGTRPAAPAQEDAQSAPEQRAAAQRGRHRGGEPGARRQPGQRDRQPGSAPARARSGAAQGCCSARGVHRPGGVAGHSMSHASLPLPLMASTACMTRTGVMHGGRPPPGGSALSTQVHARARRALCGPADGHVPGLGHGAERAARGQGAQPRACGRRGRRRQRGGRRGATRSRPCGACSSVRRLSAMDGVCRLCGLPGAGCGDYRGGAHGHAAGVQGPRPLLPGSRPGLTRHRLVPHVHSCLAARAPLCCFQK